MITERFKQEVEKGLLGDNWGLSMGMPKLEHYIDGVGMETYTLIFGPSGSGKTTLALYAYIFRPLMDHLEDDNFRVIYYSLEMPGVILFAKLASMYIQEIFGVEITVKDMFSKHRGKILTAEELALIEEACKWLEKVEKRVVVYDKLLNADVLKSTLTEEMKKSGTFEDTETGVVYIPNNPKQVVLVVLDHCGLLRTAQGRTLKQEIDLASSTLVSFRNRCKLSPLVLMQMNRESTSMDRRKAGMQEPQRSDVKESGNLEQDCEIMLATFDPKREMLAEYRKYDVTQLPGIMRSIILLKNRYGDGDVVIPVAFYGACGIWKELPKPDVIDYEQFKTPLDSRPCNEASTADKKPKMTIKL